MLKLSMIKTGCFEREEITEEGENPRVNRHN